MIPVSFPGSTEIAKPENMTDEECTSLPAYIHRDLEGNATSFTSLWLPSREDLIALNAGHGIFITVHASRQPPLTVFTLDKNNNANT